MTKQLLSMGQTIKRLWLSATFFSFTQLAAAQPVDSSYHNYLYDNRSIYFNQLPTDKKSGGIFWRQYYTMGRLG